VGLFSKIKDRLSAKAADQATLTERFLVQTTELKFQELFEASPLKTTLSEEWSKTQRQLLGERVAAIRAAPNRKMACRKCLCESVSGMARYWVLIMKPPPEPEESGFRGLPGITGELYPHLLELAKKDTHLREGFLGVSGNELTWNDVYDFALIQYWLNYIWAMAANHMRISEMDDSSSDEDKDWFKPLLHAMCAWQEGIYRQELGMPSVLDSGGLTPVALQYSSLLNMVMNGFEQPYVEWLEAYKDNIAAGTLKVPEFEKPG
jgi:hypothetical protein